MISILMPLYNGIEYIRESVTSVLNQTYKEWELIIGVNGYGKNSKVYQSAKKYEDGKKVFVYDFFDYRGKSNTLNKMLSVVNNDIICILDVDDRWEPIKLKRQIDLVGGYDIIGTQCAYFGERSGYPYLHIGKLGEDSFSEFNTMINSSAMIVRRNRNILWKPEWDGVEDYDLWLRLSKEKWSFYNINEVLVHHRVHRDSYYNTKNRELSQLLMKESGL